MLTIIGEGEEDCALCLKSKDGIATQSEAYGESFFCWLCLKKIVRLAGNKARVETTALMPGGNGR